MGFTGGIPTGRENLAIALLIFQMANHYFILRFLAGADAIWYQLAPNFREWVRWFGVEREIGLTTSSG
jgi:hypothetical protein